MHTRALRCLRGLYHCSSASSFVRAAVRGNEPRTRTHARAETNGEQHLWLHNYIADNSLPLSGGCA